MHHYTNEKRFGLTVSHTSNTLSFCLPNNGYPVITLNNEGAHSIRAYPVDNRQFAAFCALVETANALLPVLDLIFSDNERDVLESSGWELVNQPAELIHDILLSPIDMSQQSYEMAELNVSEVELMPVH
ncbi:MAG TPA: hypothetical protein V6D07_11275 [Trichocoleus sp.]